MEQNIVQSLLDAIAPKDFYRISGDGKPYVVVPKEYRIQDVEHMLPAPIRKDTMITVHDFDSLIWYAKKHGSMDECVFYVCIGLDKNSCNIVAVINDHGEDKPQWRDHRCNFAVLASLEFARWNEMNRVPLAQNNFAAFLEDNVGDIQSVNGSPSGSEMLKLALEFEANSSKRFRSKTNLQSGGFTIEFVDEESNDTRSTMKVFERFTIGIPIFEGSSNAYPIEARLKYREKEGKLMFWYELIRPDRVYKIAIHDELERVKEKTGFPVIFGTP
jgi:uncharacterized protein YfdQ (DUF2303 family)